MFPLSSFQNNLFWELEGNLMIFVILHEQVILVLFKVEQPTEKVNSKIKLIYLLTKWTI